MRRLFAVSILIPILVVAPAQAQLSTDYDSGPIVSISEGMIHVKGNKGDHIIEPIGVCSWCEADLEVLITFKGFSRGALRPYVGGSATREIKAFIVRDGRE